MGHLFNSISSSAIGYSGLVTTTAKTAATKKVGKVAASTASTTLSSVPDVVAIGNPGGAARTAEVTFSPCDDPAPRVGAALYQIIIVDATLVNPTSPSFPDVQAVVNDLNSTSPTIQAKYIPIPVKDQQTGELDAGNGTQYTIFRQDWDNGLQQYVFYVVDVPNIDAGKYYIFMKAQDGKGQWTHMDYTAGSSSDAVAEGQSGQGVDVAGPVTPPPNHAPNPVVTTGSHVSRVTGGYNVRVLYDQHQLADADSGDVIIGCQLGMIDSSKVALAYPVPDSFFVDFNKGVHFDWAAASSWVPPTGTISLTQGMAEGTYYAWVRAMDNHFTPSPLAPQSVQTVKVSTDLPLEVEGTPPAPFTIGNNMLNRNGVNKPLVISHVPAGATVDIIIYDIPNGWEVKRLSGQASASGRVTCQWDMTNYRGSLLPPAAYRYIIYMRASVRIGQSETPKGNAVMGTGHLFINKGGN